SLFTWLLIAICFSKRPSEPIFDSLTGDLLEEDSSTVWHQPGLFRQGIISVSISDRSQRHTLVYSRSFSHRLSWGSMKRAVGLRYGQTIHRALFESLQESRAIVRLSMSTCTF